MLNAKELKEIKTYKYHKDVITKTEDRFGQTFYLVASQKGVAFYTAKDCKRVIDGLLPEYDVEFVK